MIGICLALIDEPSDREKFNAVYEHYKKIMYNAAFAILNNDGLAQEAVQESFLKIARNIGKISDAGSGRTAGFVIIITRNTALTILQKENRFVPVADCEDIEDVSLPDIEAVISGSGLGIVMDIISDMDVKYRDTMVLKYLYGYSYAEIAELLEITQKNVMMRIYRGRLYLKSRLEENGYDIK